MAAPNPSPVDVAKNIREEYFQEGMSPNEAYREIFADNKISVKYEGEKGRLKKNDDGTFVISLPTDSSPMRDTFTIAHELGHLFLDHKLDQHGEIYRSGVSSPEEVAANRFAAELLMPQESFTEKAREFDCDGRRLADYFCVSPAAALVRMAVLKLSV